MISQLLGGSEAPEPPEQLVGHAAGRHPHHIDPLRQRWRRDAGGGNVATASLGATGALASGGTVRAVTVPLVHCLVNGFTACDLFDDGVG